MKKVSITLLAFMFFTIGAFAQTTSTATAATKKTDMKDLRKEIRAERKAERLRKNDLKHGETVKAEAETKLIQADKKEIAANVNVLKNEGVKHPLKRADRQIHRHNELHHHH